MLNDALRQNAISGQRAQSKVWPSTRNGRYVAPCVGLRESGAFRSTALARPAVFEGEVLRRVQPGIFFGVLLKCAGNVVQGISPSEKLQKKQLYTCASQKLLFQSTHATDHHPPTLQQTELRQNPIRQPRSLRGYSPPPAF